MSEDSGRFDRLYRDHSAVVYGYLRRILRHEQDAEDATVETFRRVLGGLGRFRGESSDRTWVMRIATNVAVRTKAIQHKHATALAGPINEESAWAHDTVAENQPEIIVLDSQRAGELLEGIPMPQRAAVWLRVGLEYTDEEVAEILSVPVGTVKSWVWRSLARLRKKYLQRELEPAEVT